MPDETEPTPAAPADPTPDAAAPPESGTGGTPPGAVRVPKWVAAGVAAVALAGGGFAVGHVTASDHHHEFSPISDNRGGPGGRDGRGGPGGLDGGGRGDVTRPGAPNGTGTGTGGDTTPDSTPSTGT